MALTTINSSGIKDDSIVNADIKSDAAIAKSKLASLDLVNADINASAAIAGSKISPDFGSQNIVTTGQIQVTAQIPAQFKRAVSGTSPVNVLIGNDTRTWSLEAHSTKFSINDYTAVNVERLVIDNTGNVTIKDAKQLLFENDAQNASSAILNLGASGTSNLAFATGSGEKVRIDSSGNLGIGVTDPSPYYSPNLVIATAASGGITLASNGDHTNYFMFADGSTGSDRYAGYIGYSHSTDTFVIRGGGNGTKGVDIESDGDLNIIDGNLAVANGHGIDFSATGTPLSGSSSSSELFQDYEKGSWTMGFEYYNTTTSAWTTVPFDNSPDYTSFDYVKCGHLVHVWGYTGGFNVGSDAVNKSVRLTGLPYSAVWAAPYYGATCIFTHTSAFGDSSGNVEYVANGYTPYNLPVLYPVRPKSDALACWMDGSKTFMFSATYETAS